MNLGDQVKDATLKKVKALEEQKEAVETERDNLKVGHAACTSHVGSILEAVRQIYQGAA